MRHLILTLTLVLAFAASAAAADMEFGPFYWNQDLTGNISRTGGAAAASGSIVEDGDSRLGYGFRWKLFDLQYSSLRSVNAVNGNFTFAGVNFNGNATLDSDMQQFDLFLRKRLAKAMGGKIYALLGFKLLNTRYTVTEQLVGTSTVDESVPLPLIGVHGSFDLAKTLRFQYGLKYLDIEVSDVDVKVVDTYYAISYRAAMNMYVDLGWRSFSLDAAYHQDSANESAFVNLKNAGYYLGATYRF